MNGLLKLAFASGLAVAGTASGYAVFGSSQAGELAQPNSQLPSAQVHGLLVTEFIPANAPDILCVFAARGGAVEGAMSCFPRANATPHP